MIKRFLYILLLLLFSTSAWATQTTGAGVWSIWDNIGDFPATSYTFFKGKMIPTTWAAVEPTNNNFSFTQLNTWINSAVTTEGYDYVMVKIYVGPNSPSWIYNNSVPEITTTVNTYGQPYPYYPDTNYTVYFKRLIDNLFTFLNAHAHKAKIVAVQAPIGRSGDVSGYAGSPSTCELNGVSVDCTPYSITEGNNGLSNWEGYQKTMFQYWYDKFNGSGITPIFHANRSWISGWLDDNTPNHWRKFAKGGHCYQHANMSEKTTPASKGYTAGWAIATRDEMDKSAYARGKFTDAPKWFIYWTALHALYIGIDFWNIEDVNDAAADTTGYDFFNTYAGYHAANESPGAWIAFRDGLDYADTSRFASSASPYGFYKTWWTQDGIADGARYTNIASDFSSEGAVQETDFDPKRSSGPLNATTFNVGSCKHDQINDVGFDTLKHNYSMYLTQIEPSTYDHGYWRVGAITQPYGRYARGFENSPSSLNNIYLDLDDSFIDGAPVRTTVTVRVVYLNQDTNQWSLYYNAVGDNQKLAYTHTNTNTDDWQEKEVTLSDTYFNNAGPVGADIWLSNADTNDDKFHMVEITRATTYYIYDAMPSDDDVGTAVDVNFSWTNPAGTVTVDVFFDTATGADTCDLDVSDRVVDDLLVTQYDPGTLAISTEYCWRVDVNHAGGTQVGDEYTFTTAGGPPAPPEVKGITAYAPGGAVISYSGPGGTEIELGQ
jgi:hypothetical protein